MWTEGHQVTDWYCAYGGRAARACRRLLVRRLVLLYITDVKRQPSVWFELVFEFIALHRCCVYTNWALLILCGLKFRYFYTDTLHPTENNLQTRRLSYRKQITCQHLWHKKFGQGWGVVEPVKIFLSSSLIMQNLVALCQTVWAHVGCAKKSGVARVPLHWERDGVWPCWNTPTRTLVTISDVVGLAQTVWAYSRMISADHSCSALQGPSRPLEPTRIDRPPLTSC